MVALPKYRRWMAIGCSHGELADKHCIEAVMRFKQRYKPSIRIHLGDVHDYAAFRSGARGTSDEARALGADVHAGADLIRQFAPTDLIIGNHDIRVWNLANSTNAIVAHAAAACRNEFLTACERAKVRRIIDHYDVNRSYIKYGDCTFLHGFWYNVNAIRDHAEHFGTVVLAQLHRTGIEPARRSDHARGYCVGTLANIPMMEYAATRRNTATWGHGFAWGETSETECIVHLSECKQGQAANWRLPL